MDFWCPPGIKCLADPGVIYCSLITALIITAKRYALDYIVFRPLGYRICRNRNVAKKFGEGLWRLLFYASMSIYGWAFVLWDKPYLKNPMLSLENYPNHPISNEEWWYYNIELAFYFSLIITQFIDTKRKDFWQMFVHHIVTILLLSLSWICGFHRIGSLVLAIHDVADVPLEGAKLAKYCKAQRLADLVFAIFTVTWLYTRCWLLPTKVLYYTTYKALDIIPFFPAYYVFNGLLCLLQLLHFAWTVLIMRMVYDALKNDGMRDLRSDSEDATDDERPSKSEKKD